MILRLALRRLLTLLAVLSLALTPVVGSAATVGMHAPATAPAAGDHHLHLHHQHHAASDRHTGDADGSDVAGPGEMPCCPPAKAEGPDCGKGCPLMALCLATTASLPPTAITVPVPVAACRSASWPELAASASAGGGPLPEPPRA